MATYCTDCGKKISITGGMYIDDNVFCDKCYYTHLRAKNNEKANIVKIAKESLNKILITTIYSIEGKRIIKYFDMISSEIFIGTGMLSELSTSIDDFFGAKSEAYTKKIDVAKLHAFEVLKVRANELGANAILGAKVEYMITNNNVLMYSVCGTPVILEENIS